MPKAGSVWIDISVNTKAMKEAVDEIRKGVDQINKSMAAAAKGTEKSTGRMRRSFRRMRQSWSRSVKSIERGSERMLEAGEETVQVLTVGLATFAGVSIWAANNYESNMLRIRSATKGGEKAAKGYESVVRSVYASGVPKSLGETTRSMQILLSHMGQIPKTKAEKYMKDLAAASWFANRPMDELLLNALDLKKEFNIGVAPSFGSGRQRVRQRPGGSDGARQSPEPCEWDGETIQEKSSKRPLGKTTARMGKVASHAGPAGGKAPGVW